ncbi:MAG: hypothetical protein ABIK90_03540, partial [candidate division WOR-3 bacterium]
MAIASGSFEELRIDILKFRCLEPLPRSIILESVLYHTLKKIYPPEIKPRLSSMGGDLALTMFSAFLKLPEIYERNLGQYAQLRGRQISQRVEEELKTVQKRPA